MKKHLTKKNCNLFILACCFFGILISTACGNDTYLPPPNYNPNAPLPIEEPDNPEVVLSVDEGELDKYARVTLNWTSPDAKSTYYVYRGNTNIATCGPEYCWREGKTCEYHFTDSNVRENQTYVYTIRDKDLKQLSNPLSVTVPVLKVQEPKDGVTLNENLVCSQKFWGTWIKMSTGVEYTVFENYVTSSENDTFAISAASTESKLVVDNLTSFSVENDSNGAILVDKSNVPYFRKGGVNLEYQMKLVGLKSSRAAGSSANLKIKGKSKKYSSYKTQKEAQLGETVSLTAPTAGDSQTIEVLDSDDKVMIEVSDLIISNTGENMGTIAISDGEQYTLKVTGTINEEDKTQGYLYSGIEYPLTLTLRNNSDFVISSSSLKITAASPYISVRHQSGKSLDGIAVGKMVPESVDNEQLFVTYSGTESGYIDTGLIVEITNGETEEVWEDYIPLRFFSSVLPVTFNGESIKNTENGALNGFIIYPDGNSKFFAVRSGGKKTVYVPLFNYTDEYTIAFSGATITKNLDNNAEVFYGINIGSTSEVPLETSGQNVTSYQQAGGNNHSIKNAYDISKDEASFEAYLSSGEADYYKFTAGDFTSKKITNIKDINFDTNYHITYENPKADKLILKWELESGRKLDSVNLYVNGKFKKTLSTSSISYTLSGCTPATKYVVYFTDPDDPLVTVSNTCGITTSRIKYPKKGGDIWGEYELGSNMTTLYFNAFNNKEEYKDICIYRNDTLLYDLSDLPDLFYSYDSQDCYKNNGFYMVFSLTGTLALNYTPADGCFGIIDTTVESGLTYTYHLRDSQGYRISDDITINCF